MASATLRVLCVLSWVALIAPQRVFPCTVSPRGDPPTSVHRLKPEDIDIVAAMGDSLTAGYGAAAVNLADLSRDFRNLSWTGGGGGDYSSVLTLPNILREYNPNLEGFATSGNAAPSLPPPSPPAAAELNVARSGDVIQGLYNQAVDFIGRLEGIEGHTTKWKLLSIFIGTNNLCQYCTPSPFFPEAGERVFRADLEAALTLLKTNVTRLFVNLVSLVDPSELYPLKMDPDTPLGSPTCDMLHKQNCGCGTSDDPMIRANISALSRRYMDVIHEVALMDGYTTTDFTVEVQPFFERTTPPVNSSRPVDIDLGTHYDYTYWAPDCFHFSAKAHEAAALSLWNNMFQPMRSKSVEWWADEELQCPHPARFLCTSLNAVHDCQANTWECPIEPRTSPTSVHKLRPSDIDLVIAMGDSLTAGHGAAADGVFTLQYDYRGVAFSGGGAEDFVSVFTLPNILRLYNPDVYGAPAEGNQVNAVFPPDPAPPISLLNVARSGEIAQDLFRQVDDIVDRMNQTFPDTWEDKWKLITLFIGSNNLCQLCGDFFPVINSTQFGRHLEDVLDELMARVPRAFVTLISNPDPTLLYPLKFDPNGDPAWPCEMMHGLFCACGTSPDPDIRAMVSNETVAYREQMARVADMDKYHTSDGFSVIVQNFLQETIPPTHPDMWPQPNGSHYDYSYWAPDCFHFGVKAHRAAALAAWNALYEPYGEKSTAWTLGEPAKCPPAGAYFCTKGNGGECLTGPPPPAPTPEDDGGGGKAWIAGVVAGGISAAILVGAVVAFAVHKTCSVKKGYVDLDPKAGGGIR